MDTIERMYIKELHNDNSTHKESLELIERIRSGDEKARKILTENYLLYVVQIANKHKEKNPGLQKSDLIQEGNIGLMTAIDKFDPSRGASFVSCAKLWIEQSIRRNATYKKGVVRLPENVTNLMISGRWEGANFREVSIDAPNEEGDSMADTIADETCDIFQREEEMLMKKKAENIMSFLQPREKEIVKACYGIGMDKPLEISQIAELYGLTSTRISQILKNSMKKMRVSYESLPESQTKTVEIVSAKYGLDSKMVDVTDKVVDLYLAKEQIKSGNKLGGDPAPGNKKSLVIEYIHGEEILTKSFQEGSFVKF
jgi:RNA polymerase primary sigma factor